LKEGASFGESLTAAEGWIPEFDSALLAAGETSGRLDTTFRLLSVYYRNRAKIYRDTIAGLLSTILTLHVFLLVFPLSLLTGFAQGLINGNISQVIPFVAQKVVVFGFLYGAVFLLLYAGQANRGERWRSLLESFVALVPLLGTAVRFLNLSRLSAALEALVRSGVPLITGWRLASAASGSPYLKRLMSKWKVHLEEGSTPAELVNRTSYFPEMFAHLYFSGEQSGQLDDALQRLHIYYQEEGFRVLRLFTRVLNGIIYGGVVILVAFNVIRFWMNYYGSIMNF
ncbi:MAG: type II secretion system F family protein, partial [Limisphaerales bacterium]